MILRGRIDGAMVLSESNDDNVEEDSDDDSDDDDDDDDSVDTGGRCSLVFLFRSLLVLLFRSLLVLPLVRFLRVNPQRRRSRVPSDGVEDRRRVGYPYRNVSESELVLDESDPNMLVGSVGPWNGRHNRRAHKRCVRTKKGG